MSNANRHFNNGFRNEPSALINKGKEEEDLKADDNGEIINQLKLVMDEKDHVLVREGIRRYLITTYKGPLGVEIRDKEEFKYLINNQLSATDRILPAPDGAGPRPIFIDENSQTYQEKEDYEAWLRVVKRIENRIDKDYTKYQEDKLVAIESIFKIYCTRTVRNGIEKDKDLKAAQANGVSILEFLKVLNTSVRKYQNPNASGINIRNKERDELKKLVLQLKVSDFGNALIMVQIWVELIERLKEIKIEERIERLPLVLNAATRKARVVAIKEEVEDEIDEEVNYNEYIYWEIFNHGMTNRYQKVFADRRAIAKVSGRDTGYASLKILVLELMTTIKAEQNDTGQVIYMVKDRRENNKRKLNVIDAPRKDQKLQINLIEVKQPCTYCMTRLNYPKAAKSHEITSCIYNKDVQGYVGDEEKLKREQRADAFAAGRQRDSNRGGRPSRGRGSNRGGRRGGR